MGSNRCENCDALIPESNRECETCGYPQNGEKNEKLAYNLQVIDLKSWVIEAGKSVKAIPSLAIIFTTIAVVVLAFNVMFKSSDFQLPLLFLLLACGYIGLYLYSRRSPYTAVVFCFLYYTIHTIYEFNAQLVIPDLSESDRGDSAHFTFFAFFLKVVPFAYIMIRIALLGVIGRGLYFIYKIKKYPLILRFIRSHPDKS